MRKLAPLALLTLAGLAAMTFVPTAAALCADDGNGGCQAMKHDLPLDVQACRDGTVLCLLAPEGVDAVFVPAGGVLNLTIKNSLGVAIEVELLVIARMDDAQSDDGAARVRADEILSFAVAAGQTVTQEQAIDGNVSKMRIQALASDGRHGETDAEATPIMAMTGGVVEDDTAEPRDEDLADDSAPVDGKDAPYLGIVAVVGVLAAIVGLRRYD